MSRTEDPPLDPAMQAIADTLTPEQLDAYKKQGEYIFNSVDFDNVAANNATNVPSAEAVAYIEDGLRSGLHISCLEHDEKQLLHDTFGEKWYERYGYTIDDVILCASCRRGPSMLVKPETLKRCSGCSNVWYCSQEHQKMDWKEHKKVCANKKS